MPIHERITIIKGEAPGLKAYLAKLWAHKYILIVLTVRDIKIKYAQTFLGILWTLIQPLSGVLVFTLFFTYLIKMETQIPYPLIALSGMAAWYFFSKMVNDSGLSLVQSSDLIKKVYFPRIILLMVKILSGLIDFTITIALLFILMLIYGVVPGWEVLLFPVFLLLTIICGLSISLWLSALTLRYRDFHHIIPYLLNYGIWLTPVFFPTTIIPDALKWLLYLNPMAAVIAGFRWTLLGDVIPSWAYALSFIPVLILFFSGLNYFRKNEYIISEYS